MQKYGREIPDRLNADEFLVGAKVLSFDLETKDPDLKKHGPGTRTNGHIAGVGLSTDTGKSIYLDVKHPGPKKFPVTQVYNFVKEVMERPIMKLGQNVSYDLDYLQESKIYTKGRVIDTMIAEALIDENKQGQYNLDALSYHYLGIGKEKTRIDEICEECGWKGAAQGHVYKMPASDVEEYGIIDTVRPIEIYKKQYPILVEQELLEVFDIETRLIPVLMRMRKNGVRINESGLDEAIYTFEKQLKELHARLNYIAGYDVRYTAASSLRQVMDAQGIPYPLTTKTKAPSITKALLERYAPDNEVCKLVLDCRELSKFIDTFLKNSLTNHLVNGRIHCQFNQIASDGYGTVTGRFSSSNPNLQQIPSRNKILGPVCRSLFIPEEGELWGKADYSQIEMVIMLHFAMGKGAEEFRQSYIDSVRAGIKFDTHQECANMAGIPDNRRGAKSINLGTMYGMGIDKTARELGVPKEEAREFSNMYHNRMPFVKFTANQCQRVMERKGYVRTYLGRRRRIADKNFAYKAFNAVDQGTSADMMKVAMVNAEDQGLWDVITPLLTVHDELDNSIPDTKEGKEAFSELVHTMETALDLKVPVLADPEIGPNWGTLEDFPYERR